MTPDRVRQLVVVAFKTSGYAFVVIAALVAVTLVAANSDLTGTYGAIAAGWLAVHQVPLTIGHGSLSILPLVPTAALMWAAGTECARAVRPEDSLRDLGALIGAAVAGPFAITLIALIVIDDASEAIPLENPNALLAIGWVVAVHMVAALIGVGSRLGERIPAAGRLPSWSPAATAAGVTAVRRLLGAATIVTVASLVWHWSRIAETVHELPGVSGALGITVLSLLYLPNVVFGALALLMGGSVALGSASIGMFAILDGPRPPVPVLLAVPGGSPAWWWPVLFVAPMYIAVVLGRECAMRSADRRSAVLATAAAAAGIAVVLTLVAVVAGGNLGDVGRIGVTMPLFGLLLLGWLAVPGCVAAAFAHVGGVTEPPLDQQVVSRSAVEFPALAGVRMRERVVDAELVEAPEHCVVTASVISDEHIVDAEVVEADLLDEGQPPGS